MPEKLEAYLVCSSFMPEGHGSITPTAKQHTQYLTSTKVRFWSLVKVIILLIYSKVIGKRMQNLRSLNFPQWNT